MKRRTKKPTRATLRQNARKPRRNGSRPLRGAKVPRRLRALAGVDPRRLAAGTLYPCDDPRVGTVVPGGRSTPGGRVVACASRGPEGHGYDLFVGGAPLTPRQIAAARAFAEGEARRSLRRAERGSRAPTLRKRAARHAEVYGPRESLGTGAFERVRALPYGPRESLGTGALEPPRPLRYGPRESLGTGTADPRRSLGYGPGGAEPRRPLGYGPGTPESPYVPAFGPGPVEPFRALAPPAMTLALGAAPPPPLSPKETAVLTANVLDAWDPYGGMQAGLVPLRVDRHPDGRLRLVWQMTEVPEDFHEEVPRGKTRPPPGMLVQKTFTPEFFAQLRDTDYAWKHQSYVSFGAFDPDPAWLAVADGRVRVGAEPAVGAKPVTERLDEALDRSGYKAPAKLRLERRRHWRRVAAALWERYPVAPEVLADYPDLARFYASVLTPSPTRTDVDMARAALDASEDPDVTVEWSVDGLLLHTRGKDSKIIAAIRGLRNQGGGSFKWSSTLGSWYRPQSVGVSESTVDIDRVADLLRAAGLVVAVKRTEVGSLGEANTRRQGHKFWRSERYATRGETALDRATTHEDRAASIRAAVPVGAPTARAERAEARADRAEGRAADELAYAQHAASTSANLARTAAGYETTATITRKEAERRADGFGRLFVPKVKGAVGARELRSDKTDNLSAYVLRWLVIYPPASLLMASVTYDGRVLTVSSHKLSEPMLERGYISVERTANAMERSATTFRADVSALAPDAVFAMAVEALPKYTADENQVPTNPRAYSRELGLYGKKRTAALAQAGGAKIDYFSPASEVWGNWQETHWDEAWGAPVPRSWRIAPAAEPTTPWHYVLWMVKRRGDEVLRKVDLDFGGVPIPQAWEMLLAAVAAASAGTPYVPTAPKPRATRTSRRGAQAGVAAPSLAGALGTEALDARDAARLRAETRRAELAESAGAVAFSASSRLAALRERADAENAHEALVEQARGEGHTSGFYPTPPPLALEAVARAEILPGEAVLEPSAGMGALVDPLLATGARVTAIEFNPARRAYLEAAYAGRVNFWRNPHGAAQDDFLAFAPSDSGDLFDAVVMNPPFSVEGMRTTDALHVAHALRFVRPGGRVVAIMSPGSPEPSNGNRRALHQALAGWDVEWVPLHTGAFRVSGTEVATVLLVAHRPRSNPGHRRAGRGRSGH